MLSLLRSPDVARVLAAQGQPSLTPFLDTIPVLILAVAFTGTLVTSFGVLLQGLYLAGDMDFLLSAPVPTRAVFITKMLQAILPNFSLIMLFSLPVLFGLGASGGYNFLYFPVLLILLALLALAAAGISSLLVMGVVRIFPARRIAEVLGLVGATISIICSQSGNFINLLHLQNQNISPSQIPIGALTRFSSPYIPLSWPGLGLVAIGEGRWLAGLFFFILTVILAGGAFLFALRTAERLYYSGWASIQVGGRRKRTAPTAAPAKRIAAPGPAAPLRILPAPVRAVLAKDFLTLRRDLRNMSQLVTPIILGIVYALFFLRPGSQFSSGGGDIPLWVTQGLSGAVNFGSVAMALFVGMTLVSRLGLISFSQEGKNYWMLRTSPAAPRYLLAGKYLVTYLPALAISWIVLLLIGVLQGVSVGIILFGLLVIALSNLGTAGISLAFGVVGVNLTWEDPRRMNSGFTGCFSVASGFVYLFLASGSSSARRSSFRSLGGRSSPAKRSDSSSAGSSPLLARS